MQKGLILLAAICTAVQPLGGIDIAEKRARLEQSTKGQGTNGANFSQINAELLGKKKARDALYMQILAEYDEKIPIDDTKIQEQLKQLKFLKNEIQKLEDDAKALSVADQAKEEEGLWHQPDTTIGQLVIDYGSQDYIYLMPPEIAELNVHVSSQLAVPRAMWSEMLEMILANYGIGSKQINSYMRQLFFLRMNQSSLAMISDDRTELQLLKDDSRICFVLHPPATELKRIFQFMEKFSPQEQMNILVLSNSIVMIGYNRDIVDMLKIYDFVAQPKEMQEYRLVALQKAQSEEVAKILLSIFEGDGIIQASSDKSPASLAGDGSSGFRILTLQQPTQSIFLLGKHDQIEKACQIIQDIENRIGEVQDKTVHWYACRHSEAQELAEVLSQVYTKIVTLPDNGKDGKERRRPERKPREERIGPSGGTESGQDHLVVTAPRIGPGSDSSKRRSYERDENFIVDPKTNSIVMVVEANVLPKLKDLLKKLDVPKKMVQIDVLLFEKRVSDNNSFGLNLLRMGDAASDSHVRSLIWNQSTHKSKKKKHSDDIGASKGLLQFLISRHAHGAIPAYDLAYNFLLAQEDIQINANPTVTCVNQTPAKIAVVDQISINTGIVEIDTTKATRLKDSFSREEYGIIIQITPTIHAKADDDEGGDSIKYIHLATDVIFDTTKPSKDKQPDVTRRNIKNEVRVADGETAILGGLRRKIALDNKEMIPFLGELPGIGKLFSITNMEDSSTEMFIFITPRIVPDKTEEFREMRRKAILTRPGDIPEFLQELVNAQKQEKHALFEQSMKLLLGRPEGSNVVTSVVTGG